MPLLIHATGWWLAGLFVGATLSDSAWLRLRGAWVVAAPNWPHPLVLLVVIVLATLAARAARARGRTRALPFPPATRTLVACAVIALSGVLTSRAATVHARRCRTAAVQRFAHGMPTPLAFDGLRPLRSGPSPFPLRRGLIAADSSPRVPLNRGRGDVYVEVGGQPCAVATTLRLPPRMPSPLPAGAVAMVQGDALATDRGVRLNVDTVHAVVGREWRRAARARTGATIDRLFGARAPLVRALVIADQDGIATSVRDRFADAGLVHMLSVSGMHVAIIASALITITAALRLPSVLGALVSLALVLAYVIMLGAPAPAVRSAVMLFTVMLSKAWQRPLHDWTALALGATIPTVHPLVVLDLGWQLSVSGMAALVAARAIWRRWQAYALALPLSSAGRADRGWRRALRRAQRWLARQRGVSRWLARETLTGVVATVATAPLIAWTFGRVSVLAPITNILAGPIVAFLQPALFLALVASPMDPLAQVIADASAWPIQLLDRIAAHAAAIPFAVFHVAPTLPTALAGGVASMALIRATATRRAGPWMKLSAVALVAAAGLPFVTVGSGVLELHMIDVGQGDALALRTPRGRWVLIDAGPSWDGGDAGRRTVIPYVQRRGGPVVLMVLSHAHEDHVGGAASVITALAPRQWWEPAFVTASSGYRKALAALRARALPWRRVQPGQRWQLDGVTLDVLAPDSAWTTAQVDANETSVVLRVSYGRRRFLFMGDAEQHEEAWLLNQLPVEALRADVLKLGHHGSRTSSGLDFVRAVAPRVGLVSVGAGNRYGHPSLEVLDRFAALQVPLLRSDREGTVVIRTNGHWLDASARGDHWRVPDRPAGRFP